MKTKRLLTIAAALALAVCLATSAGALNFDIDNEGFDERRIVREPYGASWPGHYYEALSDPATTADWQATGGVGNSGYIRQWVNADWNSRAYAMYFDATPNLFGDLTGQTLQAAFTRLGVNDIFHSITNEPVRLRWTLAKYEDPNDPVDTRLETRYFSKESVSIDINDASFHNNWVNQSILMDESNFLLWPNQQMGALLSFADLLQDYDSIGFFLTSDTDDLDDYSTNAWYLLGDTYRVPHYGAYSECFQAYWGLDNFGVVIPEPATMALLGLGIAGLGFRTLRTRKTAKA